MALFVSAAEAVLVIGLFVPCTIVLVGLGGLIGVGKLPFWPLFFATTLGAILGDSLSYWIGHHYRERLYGVWPFSRYHKLLHQGQAYLLLVLKPHCKLFVQARVCTVIASRCTHFPVVTRASVRCYLAC